MRVACVGLVVDAAQGPVREEDAILAIDGQPCGFGDFDRLPSGTVTAIRGGKRIEIELPAPVEDVKIFPSYVVFLDDTLISRGEVETRVGRAGRPSHVR